VGYEAGLYDVERKNWSPGIYRGSERRVIMHPKVALGLDWPNRVAGAAPACSWEQATSWEFFLLDEDAFPAVSLARRAGEAGGTAPAVLNGANEVCVEAFLQGRLPFTGIVSTVGAVVQQHLDDGWVKPESVTLDDVLAADAWAREKTLAIVQS
jgi:1-deoxy-D-xylulose-5-phosphate reductoisomerase